jgi:hypothetical protein
VVDAVAKTGVMCGCGSTAVDAGTAPEFGARGKRRPVSMRCIGPNVDSTAPLPDGVEGAVVEADERKEPGRAEMAGNGLPL